MSSAAEVACVSSLAESVLGGRAREEEGGDGDWGQRCKEHTSSRLLEEELDYGKRRRES